MSGRPRLLDLFCGGGGAAMGYHLAGFEVVGVDIEPQPRYPFRFMHNDALRHLQRVAAGVEVYDLIHASPPCQAFSAYRRKGHGVGDGYPDLIEPVRNALRATGTPYVIENIPGAPLLDPIVLCGSMFGLDVQRHRLFETSLPVSQPACQHGVWRPQYPAATNRAPMSRRTVEIGVWRIPLEVQQRAMGIDWLDRAALSQAIPPAYTEYIGQQLLAAP